MKTISKWSDLEEFGIDPLTGEACGLAYRILCDVTARGKKLLEKVLDIESLHLRDAWNRGTDKDPHIGSIMLPPEMLSAIAVFALLESGCTEVWSLKGSTLGVEPADGPQELQCYRDMSGEDFLRRYGYFGTACDRNVHQMSGRAR